MTRALFKQPIAPDAICEADGCDRRPRATGLCHMHYVRMHRYGTLEQRSRVYLTDVSRMAPVGRNIMSLRRRHDLTVRLLAERAGLTQNTITLIAHGGDCNLDTLRAIASAFDVEVWELLKPDHFPLTEDVQR